MTANTSRPTLAPREYQILSLHAQGNTYKEIAHDLGISPGTVNLYASRLKTKLGARNLTHAYALIAGIRGDKLGL